MKKIQSGMLFLAILFVFSSAAYAQDTQVTSVNSAGGSASPGISCQTLWWYDSSHNSCQQKEFCGSYMYQGLNTFQAKTECEAGLNPAVSGKGFRYSYWQCYDGEEQKQGGESSCKSSETWQSYAKEFCQDKCYADNSKCGVNSFSVTEECYLEGTICPAYESPAPSFCTDGKIVSGGVDANGCQLPLKCEEKSTLSISSVWSDKKSYDAGEKIVIYAKIVDVDGTPATPEEGTAVGFGLELMEGNVGVMKPIIVPQTAQTTQSVTAVSAARATSSAPVAMTANVVASTATSAASGGGAAASAGNVNAIQATTAVPTVAATSIAARYFKVSEARYNPETGYYEGTSIAPSSSGTLRAIVSASKGSAYTKNADLYLNIVGSTRTSIPVPEEIKVPVTAQKSESQEAVSGQVPSIAGETTSVPVMTCTNGCAADSRCLPFGTRLAQEEKLYYCDISQSFDAQKQENDACQNNYECISNQCSNGHCVDLEKELKETRSMLANVMEWLKSIFGSKKVNSG
ncbi:MAG: hypothetical protein NT001_02700 [Candidatus Woesearchaeota archaeon]|nr:hypothetical protein [Candidatus Woesearchaeota archaeon]